MPSAMIHLLAAQEIPGGDAPLFRLGSLAPDYLSRREEKDAVHLRREPDRYQALLRLAERLDRKDPFEAGWLVHLLADLRWDTEIIPVFRDSLPPGADWFPLYRKECHRAGYALYHSKPWSHEAMKDVLEVDLNSLRTCLTIDLPALGEFRRMLVRKHEESPADSRSAAFPPELLERFARETAAEAAALLAR
jgi:hypothetical protein